MPNYCFFGLEKSCGLCTPPTPGVNAGDYKCQCNTCRFNCWGLNGINWDPTEAIVVDYHPEGWEDLSANQGILFGSDFADDFLGEYTPNILPIENIVKSAKNALKQTSEEIAENPHVNPTLDSEEDINKVFEDYGLDPTKAEDQVQAQKQMQFEAQNAAEKLQSVYIAEILKGVDKEMACIWGQLTNQIVLAEALEDLQPGDLVHLTYTTDAYGNKILAVEKATCGG